MKAPALRAARNGHRPLDIESLPAVTREIPTPNSLDEEPSGRRYQPCRLGGEHAVSVLLPEPDPIPHTRLIGMESLLERCQAAWLSTDARGAQHFRLIGPPGVGKNTLIYHLAAHVERKPLYIMQGHEELTPEDIACSARVTEDNGIEYVGSPLVAAMVHGGICFFDEIGKAPSRSLSLLAPVLDERRTLTSLLAGFCVKAHPEFRFCAALNDDDEVTSGLPGFLDERLRPALKVGFPSVERMKDILQSAEGASGKLADAYRRWATGNDRISPRTALTLLGFAGRLCQIRKLDTEALEDSQLDQLINEAAESVHLTRALQI